MSDNICPKCGQLNCTCCAQLTTNAEIGKWVLVEYIQLVDPEIARLRVEIEKLRMALKVSYKAIESLPIGTFGEGGYADPISGEECKYPIRDEILNTIASALKGGA